MVANSLLNPLLFILCTDFDLLLILAKELMLISIFYLSSYSVWKHVACNKLQISEDLAWLWVSHYWCACVCRSFLFLYEQSAIIIIENITFMVSLRSCSLHRQVKLKHYHQSKTQKNDILVFVNRLVMQNIVFMFQLFWDFWHAECIKFQGTFKLE